MAANSTVYRKLRTFVSYANNCQYKAIVTTQKRGMKDNIHCMSFTVKAATVICKRNAYMYLTKKVCFYLAYCFWIAINGKRRFLLQNDFVSTSTRRGKLNDAKQQWNLFIYCILIYFGCVQLNDLVIHVLHCLFYTVCLL